MAIGNDLPSLEGVKTGILGGGVSGTALARLAARMGARVFVSDSRELSRETASILEEIGAEHETGNSDKILGCDMAVTSSGFPPSAPIIARIRDGGVPLLGELDFVSPCLKGRVIGVTGSNGKTTTTSLLGHLLESLSPPGNRVAVVGNIGNPIAEAAGTDYAYIVAELSSFQLHWSKDFALDAAIVTNLAPDHIDWHGSYENYVADKAKILTFVRGVNSSLLFPRAAAKADASSLSPEMSGLFSTLSCLNEHTRGFAITRAEEALALKPEGHVLTLAWDVPASKRSDQEIVLNSSERRAYAFGGDLFRFGDTAMIGRHNMENTAMAMAAVGALGLNISRAREALSSYVPPPHRCALVLSSGGVSYVDDSKGTNIAACVAALSSIEGKKIVILGGRRKGENFGRLAAPLMNFAKHALLIGEASREIATALAGQGYTDFTEAGGMEEAVCRAHGMAIPGDVVLLSPACTSWDSYKNYGERGDHFASLVRRIAGRDRDV
ncbi:MAG: UDP-N-acetylmuramoyl-L-alanine--D-glutamate ligase [Synergistaceae bacterium]|jgi:UDP-N-acetylmuramoylalanine--D-glutamate ligase|nr:UDP-N-acetylmuramoyl-L-alanine--D-glutamate ligase [Synergistaceae bacterium]